MTFLLMENSKYPFQIINSHLQPNHLWAIAQIDENMESAWLFEGFH